MTLHVDLEKLAGMSKSLHSLGDEASELSALNGIPVLMLLPFGIGSAGMLSSVVEASNMAFVVQRTLIPAVSGRLGEIGDLMHAVTVQFRNGDEADAPMLANTYTTSSGNWATPR
jgi:hypothetical protein